MVFWRRSERDRRHDSTPSMPMPISVQQQAVPWGSYAPQPGYANPYGGYSSSYPPRTMQGYGGQGYPDVSYVPQSSQAGQTYAIPGPNAAQPVYIVRTTKRQSRHSSHHRHRSRRRSPSPPRPIVIPYTPTPQATPQLVPQVYRVPGHVQAPNPGQQLAPVQYLSPQSQQPSTYQYQQPSPSNYGASPRPSHQSSSPRYDHQYPQPGPQEQQPLGYEGHNQQLASFQPAYPQGYNPSHPQYIPYQNQPPNDSYPHQSHSSSYRPHHSSGDDYRQQSHSTSYRPHHSTGDAYHQQPQPTSFQTQPSNSSNSSYPQHSHQGSGDYNPLQHNPSNAILQDIFSHAPPSIAGSNAFGNLQNIGQTIAHAFRYSRCTGRKKAVCIGVNYFGQHNELRGCINDAHHVRDFLIQYHGFKERDILVLTDDRHTPKYIPTRKNILNAMNWLVQTANTDDSLFFHYSGHGGRTPDKHGDEIDGYDEVIYPVDFEKAGTILDDTMHDIMMKGLPEGCRLTALFDCCHSGTILDLPYVHSSGGLRKDARITNKARRRMACVADILSIAACHDDQTSADTFQGGVAIGATSWAFIKSLKRQPQQSYQDLLKNLYDTLHEKYNQTPQLGSSHPIDLNKQFVL